jgi:hypothetical protein
VPAVEARFSASLRLARRPCEAGEESRRQGDERSKAQRRGLERDGLEPGQFRRTDCSQQIEADRGDRKSRQAAQGGEQHASGQQLPEHAGTAGAQRGADAQFPATRSRRQSRLPALT